MFTFVFICFHANTAYSQELPTDPSFKERKAKEGYTLNLKDLINKSKKKIEQVEDKLKEQAKERRNEKREVKAREYYEKAMRLEEEGKYTAARELLEKAIKITEHPEMEGFLSKSVRRQRKKEKALAKEDKRRIKRLEVERGYTAKEVNKKYKEGIVLYKDKNYLAAKVIFEEVNQMFPDHRATNSYIALIDRNIEDDQKELIETKLGSQEFASSKAKARWRKELEEQEKKRRQKLQEQAGALYKEAIDYYKDRQFEKAKEKFKEVEWVLPDYKKTIKYLSKIDKDIAKHGVSFSEQDKLKYFKKEVKADKKADVEDMPYRTKMSDVKGFTEAQRKKEEAEFVYEAATTLYKKKYYEQSLEKFYEVASIYPGYKKTEKYVRKLHKKVPGSIEQIDSLQRKVDQKYGKLYQPPSSTNQRVVEAIANRDQGTIAQAEDKYQQAVNFYNNRNFTEAQRKFIAVEAIIPGYKATRDYLGYIDGDMSGGFFEPKSLSSPQRIAHKTNATPIKSYQQEDINIKEHYSRAKRLFKAKNYKKAKGLFEEVSMHAPGYRGTDKYLVKLDKIIEKEDREREQYQIQQESDNNNYKSEYEKPKGLLAKFKKDKTKSSRSSMKKTDNQYNKSVQKNEKENIQDIYDEAKKLYLVQNYVAAKQQFTVVENLKPGYKRAAAYIKRIDQKVIEENKEIDKSIAKLEKEEQDLTSMMEAQHLKKEELKELEARVNHRKKMSEEAERVEKLKKEKDKELEQKRKFREQAAKEKEAQQIKEDKIKREALLDKDREILAALRKLALEKLEFGEYVDAKELMYKYERSLIISSLPEKERMSLKDSFEMEKSKVRIRKEEKRLKDEMLAYKEQEQAKKDSNVSGLDNAIDNNFGNVQLEKLDLKIKKEEELLAKYQRNEKLRMKMLENNKAKRNKDNKTFLGQLMDDSDLTPLEIKIENEMKEERKAQKKQEKLVAKLKKKRNKLFERLKREYLESHEDINVAQTKKDEEINRSLDETLSKEERVMLGQEKQKEIEELVAQRQKEIRVKRDKIQKDFDKGIAKLYKKAVKLHRKGLTDESGPIFWQIQNLKPGYKKTEKYLTKTPGFENFQVQTPTTNKYVRPVIQKVQGRMGVIKNALDTFEKKMW